MPLLAHSVAGLAEKPEVAACLDWFRRSQGWINEQHLKLCRVPAATFLEQERAEWMAQRFRETGWESGLDRAGNVAAWLPGRQNGPHIAVTAHLDTVLAPRVPEDIRVADDGRFLGPGISDNGAGLAALLALAAGWNANPPLEEPAPDSEAPSPLLVANVGEEGEGNLCGMRYLCRDTPSRPRAFLVLDGPGTEHITCRALASRRYELVISGPGGHSWSDHGTANPVHAIALAIANFTAEVGGERLPRSSHNFGLIQGGTSVNCIPAEARAKIDLRSEDPARIDRMAALLASCLERAAETENGRAPAGRISTRLSEIGSRPGGELAQDAPLMEGLLAVDNWLGIRSFLDCSSTDANIPLSLGLPAVSIGAGGRGGGAHTPGEWFHPEGRELGLRRILLTLCLLLGGE